MAERAFLFELYSHHFEIHKARRPGGDVDTEETRKLNLSNLSNFSFFLKEAAAQAQEPLQERSYKKHTL